MISLGDAPVKREGGAVSFDLTQPDSLKAWPKETYWYERSFTKAQYAALADALVGNSKIVRSVRKDFRRLAKNEKRKK